MIVSIKRITNGIADCLKGAALVYGVPLLFAQAGAAPAAEFSPQVWINPGVYSYHFNRSRDLREDNVGAGVEVLFARDHGIMGGTFINSDRQRSHYLAYQWRPLHWEGWGGMRISAGVIAGAFDGYPKYRSGDWFVAPLPLLAIEGDRIGVNLTIVPTIKDRLNGAIGLQIKLRVW